MVKTTKTNVSAILLFVLAGCCVVIATILIHDVLTSKPNTRESRLRDLPRYAVYITKFELELYQLDQARQAAARHDPNTAMLFDNRILGVDGRLRRAVEAYNKNAAGLCPPGKSWIKVSTDNDGEYSYPEPQEFLYPCRL